MYQFIEKPQNGIFKLHFALSISNAEHMTLITLSNIGKQIYKNIPPKRNSTITVTPFLTLCAFYDRKYN